MSDFLQTHGLQHARLPCPSPSPEVCSNSCPLSSWCHSAISFPATPFFSSCPQSFPASGSFPVSWLFASGGQTIGPSASSPSNEYSTFSLGLTALISLLLGLSRVSKFSHWDFNHCMFDLKAQMFLLFFSTPFCLFGKASSQTIYTVWIWSLRHTSISTAGSVSRTIKQSVSHTCHWTQPYSNCEPLSTGFHTYVSNCGVSPVTKASSDHGQLCFRRSSVKKKKKKENFSSLPSKPDVICFNVYFLLLRDLDYRMVMQASRYPEKYL